jgi:hypothetical protein
MADSTWYRDENGDPICDRWCPFNRTTICGKTQMPIERLCLYQVRRDRMPPALKLLEVIELEDGRWRAELVGLGVHVIADTRDGAIRKLREAIEKMRLGP